MIKFCVLISIISLSACTNKVEEQKTQLPSKETRIMSLGISYKVPDVYEIVPGVSLGDVNIGETRESLIAKGFVEDKEFMESEKYLVRDFVHVFIESNKAATIWLNEYYRDKLRYKGQKISKNINEIKKTFSNCGEVEVGSGGKYFSCENDGVKFVTRFPSEDYISVSVTASK